MIAGPPRNERFSPSFRSRNPRRGIPIPRGRGWPFVKKERKKQSRNFLLSFRDSSYKMRKDVIQEDEKRWKGDTRAKMDERARITINRVRMIDFRLPPCGFEVSRLLEPLRNPLRVLVATSESDLSKRSSLDRACDMSHISIVIFTTVTYIYIAVAALPRGIIST